MVDDSPRCWLETRARDSGDDDDEDGSCKAAILLHFADVGSRRLLVATDLGSGLIDYSQKVMAAAIQIADK
jgi:hypothetical protein